MIVEAHTIFFTLKPYDNLLFIFKRDVGNLGTSCSVLHVLKALFLTEVIHVCIKLVIIIDEKI